MKKFFYSLFAIIFISSQALNAAGYLATYSMKVSNPAAYVEALDELMNTDWGKSFAGDVSLHQYAFNGYDDATHVVVLNYENPESLGTATESFTDPVFLSFFAATASLAEPIEQSLNMKLISVYNENPDEDQVYTIYRMQVKDASAYAKEYTELTNAQVEADNIQGSYGLRQLVAGDTRYYTHYAFTSAPSVAVAMKSAETLYGSDSFAKFADKVDENRRVMNISILINVVNYPAN